MTQENPFGEVVYSYTRKQAIEDGVLVISVRLRRSRSTGNFRSRAPATVWAIIEAALKKDGQDLNGICHDISWMALIAVRTGRQDAGQIHFKVIIAGTKHALKLHIGPGDTPAPVLTLMLPNED
jgi:hypothetical protein